MKTKLFPIKEIEHLLMEDGLAPRKGVDCDYPMKPGRLVFVEIKFESNDDHFGGEFDVIFMDPRDDKFYMASGYYDPDDRHCLTLWNTLRDAAGEHAPQFVQHRNADGSMGWAHRGVTDDDQISANQVEEREIKVKRWMIVE